LAISTQDSSLQEVGQEEATDQERGDERELAENGPEVIPLPEWRYDERYPSGISVERLLESQVTGQRGMK
jgi:hypothetical protein